MRKVYLCDPSKNAECGKTSCQIDCFYTTHKEFEQKYISESRLTTLEEEIKKFRSVAEAAKRQSERNLVMNDGDVEQWRQNALELARDNFRLADYLECLKEIWESGDCNTCKKKYCEYKPRVGQLVRYNCMFYEREEQE